jgi:hypothetical protein
MRSFEKKGGEGKKEERDIKREKNTTSDINLHYLEFVLAWGNHRNNICWECVYISLYYLALGA